ncbi:MAG: glycerophosphodiester phosphodiesterase [Dehalococcoidia bacterium]|nr:glycerophosphodiester phosphodiesterase [Dehalococcoidia bacterium]
METAIAAAVHAAGVEAWTWFTAHPPEDAALLRRACPAARVYLSVATEPRWVADLDQAIAVAAARGLHGINPSHDALDAALVARAHARGLAVGAWTVDEPAAIERALDLGVDMITTNVPRRVFAAIAARAARG